MYKPSFLLLLVVALLFSGCYKVNKDVVRKPANLIPKDKMADIITEMQIIEGAAVYNRTHFPGYQNGKEETYYQFLFHHYHVTKEQVKASLDYYNSKGDEMAGIYDKVLAKLAEKQTEVKLEQQRIEDKKYPFRINSRHFPFIFREGPLSKYCINPIP